MSLLPYESRDPAVLATGEVVLWRGRPGHMPPEDSRVLWTLGAVVVIAIVIALARGRIAWVVIAAVVAGFAWGFFVLWMQGVGRRQWARLFRARRKRERAAQAGRYLLTTRRAFAIGPPGAQKYAAVSLRALTETTVTVGPRVATGSVTCVGRNESPGVVTYEQLRHPARLARMIRRAALAARSVAVAGGRGAIVPCVAPVPAAAADAVDPLLAGELEPGETLLWSVRPQPPAVTVKSVLKYLARWLWLIPPVWFIFLGVSNWTNSGGLAANALPGLAAGVGGLWIWGGVYSLTFAVREEARTLRGTLYAVTDRRLLKFTPAARGQRTVRSVLLHAVTDATLTENGDGATGEVSCTAMHFQHIPDPRGLYQLILRLGRANAVPVAVYSVDSAAWADAGVGCGGAGEAR